ncbi:MAG: sulfotransferase [Desulfobacteraceae bacterium]|nr:MAG: sulfotransferase [Desulfobacteraceae bacterium]
MSRSHLFEGPLFLVGMPRSGTKLLVHILNNHSMIAIPGNESHFIPQYLKRMPRYGDLKEPANFRKFHADLAATNFIKRLSANGYQLSAREWYGAVEDWSSAGIIESFYRLFAKRHNKTIWGDKTPFYMLHLPLLAEHFPDARFIHIIRDARDQCLSSRKVWNKNLYRSAQRWHDYVRQCRQDGLRMPPGRYHELFYEALIDKPAETIANLCAFIGIAFEPQMIQLKKPSENYGDAKNQAAILKQNYQKWKNELSAKQILKIEKISGALLSDLGYSVTYHGRTEAIGMLEMLAYRGLDAIHQLHFEVKRQHSLYALLDAVKQNRFNPAASKKIGAAKDRG